MDWKPNARTVPGPRIVLHSAGEEPLMPLELNYSTLYILQCCKYFQILRETHTMWVAQVSCVKTHIPLQHSLFMTSLPNAKYSLPFFNRFI